MGAHACLMRRLAAAISCLLLVSACGRSSSSPPPSPTTAPAPTPTAPPFVEGKLSVSILPSTGPRTLTQSAPVITMHLAVRGLHLDAPHMGDSPMPQHGHIQVYLDRIPADAYKVADLNGVLANLAAPLFSMGFPPHTVKSMPGRHRLLVALAQNDFVLYQVKPAVVTVTFK